MIRAEGVSKYLGGNKILDNMNLSVNKGSIYGLVGPNGAGKTTLIKCLVGIYDVEEGKVLISNENIKENKNVKSRLGYIPDYQNYYLHFKVKDMVDFYRNTYPMWNEERYVKLKSVLKLDENKKIRYLSKGMKTQLAILLNLSIMPNILILDEPTSGLDPVIRRKVLNLLVDEVGANDTTVLISTHNLGELESICDHIGIMHNGRIIMEDSLDDLKTKVRKIQVVFRDDIPDEIFKAQNILKIENRGKVYQIIVKEGIEETIEKIKDYNPILLETVDMSLEEIFIYKVGGEGYVFEDITL